MKKILLVVLVTSITGAFAAIQWNCTTDLDVKYVPTGCSAVKNTLVPPPPPTIFGGDFSSCSFPSQYGRNDAVAEYDVKPCATRILDQITAPDNYNLTFGGAICTEVDPNRPQGAQECNPSIDMWDSSYVRVGSVSLVGPAAALKYNNYFGIDNPLTSDKALPAGGGVYVCAPYALGPDSDAHPLTCPKGSYQMIIDSYGDNFNGFVLVQ